jgi:hypothetical protein
MEFPKDKVKGWKVLRDHGDAKEILERFGISYHQQRQAFEGKGKATTYVAMDTFYMERAVKFATMKMSVPGLNSTMLDAVRENGGKV